jgi:hypothetical protein
MRAVIIGTDFIKDSNGGYRVLEINTNTDVHASITDGLDWDGFKNLLTTNGIGELHFMYASNNMLVESMREEVSIRDKFVTICDELGIQYFNYELADNAIVVPDVVDSPDKLILRTAYDSNAYVDDSFAKDKINFNSLISPKEFSTNYYYNSGFSPELNHDDLVELHVSAESTPNYIVKTRFPNTNYALHPKLYKINTFEQLTELKNSLTHTEYLEEFYTNEENILNGKISVIRSLDIFYGSDLSTFNMGVYRMSSTIPFNSWPTEYDETHQMVKSSRPLWLTKFSSNRGVEYFLDETSRVLSSDGSLIGITDIKENTTLKTINLNWIPDSASGDVNSPDYFRAMVTTGSYSEDVSTFSVGITNTVYSKGRDTDLIMIEVTTETGLKWDDMDTSLIVIKLDDTDTTIMKYLNFCKVGDAIVFYNYATNQLESQKIVSLIPKFVSRKIYDLNVEKSEIFLPVVDEVNSLALIQHNFCDEFFCNFGGGSCFDRACRTCPGCAEVIK